MNRAAGLNILIRSMRSDDLEGGLRLSRASRWNQTRRDWELFLKLSPNGCRVAEKDHRVIGTVATVRYEDRFSWIGMVLVDEAERGQGIGGLLMDEALDELSEMPSIKLDATPAGHKVYRKLNFIDEYHLSRMETAGVKESSLLNIGSARPMTSDDLPAIKNFDRQVFGADRGLILEWMFDGAPEYGWVIEEHGKIHGYLFGRYGSNYTHLGPVIAQDQQFARQLVSACLSGQPGRPFILDASQQEADWREWLESIGFREQRPFIRMFYRGNPFPGLPQNQFGILGPEFG